MDVDYDIFALPFKVKCLKITIHDMEENLKKNCKENFASDLLIQEVKNPDTLRSITYSIYAD